MKLSELTGRLNDCMGTQRLVWILLVGLLALGLLVGLLGDLLLLLLLRAVLRVRGG